MVMMMDNSLPDDVLLEILLLLPWKSVFKFKCVSKVWLSLISDPRFMQRLFKAYHGIPGSLPWGTLGGVDFNGNDKLFCLKTHIDWFKDGFTFKFMLDINPFKEKAPKLRITDSSNGWVLCSHWDTSRLLCNYYICNPLTKQWVSLPSPQAAVTYYPCGIECLLVTSLGYRKTAYKVAIVPYYERWRTEFDLQVFSSDTGEWNTYKILSEEAVNMYEFYEIHNNNGCLFWRDDKIRICNLNKIDDKKLSSSGIDGGLMQSINIPHVEYHWDSFYKHGISEGFNVFGILKRGERTLSIWVLKEDCGWVWQSLNKNIIVEHHPGPSPKFFYFCPENLDVVIFRNSGHWCCFNLRTADCEALIRFPALSTAIECSRHYLIYTPKPTII